MTYLPLSINIQRDEAQQIDLCFRLHIILDIYHDDIPQRWAENLAEIMLTPCRMASISAIVPLIIYCGLRRLYTSSRPHENSTISERLSK